MLKIPQNGYLEIACSADAEYTVNIPDGILFQQGTITGGTDVQLSSKSATLDISSIVVYNSSGGNSNVTVSVAQHTSVPMFLITLAVAETLFYSSESGWKALDSTGAHKMVAGGGAGDHGGLTGLGDDDHTQYVVTNVSRTADGIELAPQAANPGTITKATVYVDDGTNYAADTLVLGTIDTPVVLEGDVTIGAPGFEQGAITVQGSSYDGLLMIHDVGNGFDAGINIHTHSTTAPSLMAFSRTNTNDQTHATLTDGQEIGRLTYLGHDGTDYNQAADIRVSVDGTPGDNAMPGRIGFFVSPDGSNTPIEALRISQDKTTTLYGNLDMGSNNIITSGTVDGVDVSDHAANTTTAHGGPYNNYTHPNHTGDVTSVADGAQTIATNAVTYSKMQVPSGDRLLGNDSGTGDTNIHEINLSAEFTFDGLGGLGITTDSISLAHITNAAANDKILGSGNVGLGDDYVEIALGTNLAMDGTTLNASSEISGPGGASTDNAVMRWNGVTGDAAEDSSVLIDDSDNMSGIENLTNNAETIRTPVVNETDDTNQWDVDGITVIRWAAAVQTSTVRVNGIKAGTEGRVIYLYNDDTDYSLVIEHDNGSATAVDRVFFTSASSLTVTPGELSGPIVYVDGKWRSAQ